MASSSVAYSAASAAAPHRLAVSKLPLAASLAIGLATLINVALFFVFSRVGLITPSVEIPSVVGPQPMTAIVVATMTVLQMLIGVVILAAIIRWRPSSAVRTWQIVAAVVLVLSFATPATGIPGAPLGYVLALEAMHIVAGVLAIWLLPALARQS
jgi:hypothetical protein